MHYGFRNVGTCSTRVEFDVEEGKLRNIRFADGCNGNLKALAALAEGMMVDEAILRLGGITCGMKGTSCGDQLARHLQGLRKQNV
ncbi:MAG TPA: TIGR03905 family TSCPD domain-containing protein [Clostridia bacterium]|nr:TIGR03905 family TSCPD domain-containing protein [Clostridia bacterium]